MHPSSYLQYIPRASGTLRLALVCWFLRRFARLEVRDAAEASLLREKLLRLDRRLFHVPRWSCCESVQVNGVEADWIEADGRQGERVVLYLHGGGFAFHLPNGYRAFAAHLSRALGARVLLPDYRLAPEHPFPAPQEDCLNAYRAILALGVPASRIVVAGDSAGGNLSLGLLQMLLRGGLPQPGCVVALSPATDLQMRGESVHAQADVDPVLSATSMPLLRSLAFAPAHWSDPVASPIDGEFSQTAPTLLMCGTREVLLDDTRRYAQRVHEAGGSVACEVWQDMPHVFPLLAVLKESRLAMARIARFVNDAMAEGAAVPGRP